MVACEDYNEDRGIVLPGLDGELEVAWVFDSYLGLSFAFIKSSNFGILHNVRNYKQNLRNLPKRLQTNCQR